MFDITVIEEQNVYNNHPECLFPNIRRCQDDLHIDLKRTYFQHRLIEFVKEDKIFRITESGTNALNIFDEMDKLLTLQMTEQSLEL